MQKIRRTTKKRALATAVGIGALVALFAIGLALTRPEPTGYRGAEIPSGVSEDRQSNEGRDETKPAGGSLEKYHVSADRPRVIYIDSIGVASRVYSMGVNANKTMQTPMNIYDTGWYSGSAKPGEDGASIINGHVTGPTQRGVFYKIGLLKQGDVVRIEKGDGEQLSYRVVKVETVLVDKLDMRSLFDVAQNSKHGLNLITCAGSFDRASQQYRSRTIVYTVQS